MTKYLQIKEFKDFFEDEVNDFLVTLDLQNIVEIKYTSVLAKGWDTDKHEGDDYETKSEIVSNVLIIYKVEIP